MSSPILFYIPRFILLPIVLIYSSFFFPSYLTYIFLSFWFCCYYWDTIQTHLGGSDRNAKKNLNEFLFPRSVEVNADGARSLKGEFLLGPSFRLYESRYSIHPVGEQRIWVLIVGLGRRQVTTGEICKTKKEKSYKFIILLFNCYILLYFVIFWYWVSIFVWIYAYALYDFYAWDTQYLCYILLYFTFDFSLSKRLS